MESSGSLKPCFKSVCASAIVSWRACWGGLRWRDILYSYKQIRKASCAFYIFFDSVWVTKKRSMHDKLLWLLHIIPNPMPDTVLVLRQTDRIHKGELSHASWILSGCSFYYQYYHFCFQQKIRINHCLDHHLEHITPVFHLTCNTCLALHVSFSDVLIRC